jgi:hypothetical protein
VLDARAYSKAAKQQQQQYNSNATAKQQQYNSNATAMQQQCNSNFYFGGGEVSYHGADRM